MTLLQDKDIRVVAGSGEFEKGVPISAKPITEQPRGGRKVAEP